TGRRLLGLLAADAIEQVRRRLVVRILVDELALERPFEDGLAEASGAPDPDFDAPFLPRRDRSEPPNLIHDSVLFPPWWWGHGKIAADFQSQVELSRRCLRFGRCPSQCGFGEQDHRQVLAVHSLKGTKASNSLVDIPFWVCVRNYRDLAKGRP